MLRVLVTVFAGLAGLAFGSFLNVCLTRWPEGESIVTPPSHCRSCGRSLAWRENVPLASWIALRGRCRSCGAGIGWRYPLVELSIGALWAFVTWQSAEGAILSPRPEQTMLLSLAGAAGRAVFFWLLVALAALDAENLWLPDFLTWPGIALGLVYNIILIPSSGTFVSFHGTGNARLRGAIVSLIGVVAAASLIHLIRWTYKVTRHREGIGLGDAKLMAMLAAWLGLEEALLAFGIGVVLGALAALVVLALPAAPAVNKKWAERKMPLGTFLCIGGIFSAVWGAPLIDAYLRWAGF
jgi:leader peptidase (prepilin peptidase) / N-methyltransferase